MIIGLGHQSRVGKDTCSQYMAEYIQDKYGTPVWQVSFAWKLKEIAHDLFKHKGVMEPQYYDDNPEARTVVIPGYGKTAVDLWIDIGQKMREVYQDVWLEQVTAANNKAITIVRDVRFPNEAEAIKRAGGFLVKITRKGQVVRGSDTAMPENFKWDYQINNNGPLEELKTWAVLVVEKIRVSLNG
jgi:hypothetical protein